MREQKLNKQEQAYLSRLPAFEELVGKNDLKFQILKGIACGGAIATMMMAPPTGLVFKWFKDMDAQHRQRIKKITDRLAVRNLIVEPEENVWVLTDKGRLYLKRLELERFGFSKPIGKWDGNFFVVTFDLPRGHDYARMTFKRTLTRAGFVMLQNSVYVYPYDAQVDCETLAQICDLQDYVSYMKCTEVSSPDIDKIVAEWKECELVR